MSDKNDWKGSWRYSVPYVTLLLGILTYSYGTFGTFENQQWKEFWSGFGKTLLAGGFFALLLKTIQFWGVFRQELEKIIYDAKFLENRKDLSEIWEKVSKVMFKNKFPKVSKDITNDVRNIYFPTQHVLYHDNFKQTLEIELINPADQIVKVMQHSEYTVYPNNRSKFPLEVKNNIRFKANKDEVVFKFVSFKVNGKEVVPKITEIVESNHLRTNYSVELSGKDSYKIETTIEKQYSLLYDNVIRTTRDNIIHNFDLKVFLKGDIAVDFYNVGTLKNFAITKVKNEHYREFEYNGIIYPKQGYLLVINKKLS